MERGQREDPPLNNDRGYKIRVRIYPNGREAEDVYVTFWEYKDSRLAEVYVQSSKLGTTLDGHLKLLGKDLSRLLQYGMPVDELARKLIGEQGPLAGTTSLAGHPNISGISDLIGLLIADRYCPAVKPASL